MPPPQDNVNHPSHYTFGRFEVIDVLEDWFPDDPLLWQVGKYIARASKKGKELEDLQKARFYLERRIANHKAMIEQFHDNAHMHSQAPETTHMAGSPPWSEQAADCYVGHAQVCACEGVCVGAGVDVPKCAASVR